MSVLALAAWRRSELPQLPMPCSTWKRSRSVMRRSDSKLAPYLNNHISRQAKIITCIARISQQKPERTSHQARQPLSILAWHDRLVPNKVGRVAGIHRVALRLSAL